jgi:hypothetical protein
MPQIPVDKTFFSFAKGINSEVSPLAFPEEASLDEQNFETLISGTRRRRKGLRRESGHVAGSISVAGTYDTSMKTSTYRWQNVEGNPDITFIVMQVGGSLLFATETEDLSPSFKTDYIDLVDMSTTGVNADVYQNMVSFSSGRGFLFVSGRYIEPFYVAYDATLDTFTASRIKLYVRDFRGISDGVDSRKEPNTLTGDHNYNLVNRGWTAALLALFKATTGDYPAKNMIYYKGLRATVDAVYADIDGIKAFDANKLEAEAFGDTSAPQGALVLSPFDTGYAKLASATLFDIDTFSYVVTSPTLWTVTVVTTAAHGLSATNTTTITNNEFSYNATSGVVATASLDGTYTVVSAPTATSITIYYRPPTGFSSFLTQYVTKGQVGSSVIIRSDSYATDERPQVCAYFAGRVWWAGTAYDQINDTIYFSQIAFNPKQFGLCYQEADPTSQFINSLTPADGGTIIVPNMGAVYGMIPMEDALVLLCANGIWVVLPTQRGGFTADGYNVRKITDAECVGPGAIRKIDASLTFCSPRGIYVLQPDQNSGQLNAKNISEQTIQTLWNAIPDSRKREVQVHYDDAKKRVYYLFGDSSVVASSTFNRAYVFDTRLAAFYPLKFSHSDSDASFKIKGAIVTGLGDDSDSAKKLKFLSTKNNSGIKLDILDLEQTVFTDFDDVEQDAYIITGYDNLGDFARHRQAPVIHVYLQKTETGFTDGGAGQLVPVGESSCLMQARWDFSDASTAGKWSPEYQVYRHVRYYQPTGVSDTFNSGFPVIITRNKLRGRGRCLHLKYRAGAGKDTHILGWAIHYVGEKLQ